MISTFNRLRSVMIMLGLISTASYTIAQTTPSIERNQLEKTILQFDSLFWLSYNTCDVDEMTKYLTDDLEFYHDKGGLTTGLITLMNSVRTGLCGNENWRLRREEVKGSLKVFPLDNYGAILYGEHVFYIVEKGKPERLDGRARFTHVWKYQDNAWKMHRVLSYDHGPATK